MVRFEPSPHRVLVKKADEVLSTRRSIITIPDSAKGKDCALAGIIMAAGKRDVEAMPFDLRVGDAVIFHVHDALEIRVDGEDFYILSMESVFGRIPASDDV